LNLPLKIVIFMVMFNIAAFLIAATGFFPYSIYGDATNNYDLDDPSNLHSPETMFNQIILNAGETFTLAGFEITFGVLMGSIVIIAIGIGALTRSTIPITLGLLSTMFLFMYNNSKTAFDQIMTHLDETAGYIGLMLGLGVLILFVIVIMDYAAGQKNA